MAQEQSGDHRRRVTCEQTPGASSAQDNRGRFQWQFRNHEGFLPWPRQKAQRADACTPLVPAFRTLRQRTKSSRPASVKPCLQRKRDRQCGFTCPVSFCLETPTQDPQRRGMVSGNCHRGRDPSRRPSPCQTQCRGVCWVKVGLLPQQV